MWVWVCRGSGSRFVTAGYGDLRLLFFFFFFGVDGRLWVGGGSVWCVKCSSGELVVKVVLVNLFLFLYRKNEREIINNVLYCIVNDGDFGIYYFIV